MIGAGAAGIAIARAFVGTRTRVAVIESGGLGVDRVAQSLNVGANLGLPYYDLAQARERRFGGTTMRWSGRCAPLDPIDFATRPWVPHSGWPIGPEVLDPYYRRAQDVLDVGEYRYDASLWQDIGLEPDGFDPATFAVRFWRIRARRFGHAFRQDLADAANVTVYLNGTVVSLAPDHDANSIRHVVVQSICGREVIVTARHFVLATGGIENARLLLASDEVERAGIGNGRDLVGRFFMEHPKCRVARIETPDPHGLLERWRKQFPRGMPKLWPALVPTAAVQERHGILNSSLAFYYRSAVGMSAAALRARPPGPAAIARSMAEIPANLVRRYVRRRSVVFAPQALHLLARGEQAPDRNSRVVLSNDRDALGQRRADLDWRLGEIDKRSARVLTELAATEFARLRLGRIMPAAWLSDGSPDGWPLPRPGDATQDHHDHLQGGNHHIGTTRMATDPSRGVTDADARVFGKANLFVAGSSVFPTSGWANPTLTIVALALRLADHLKARLP
ncbi:FAD-dependent oxidoreductase [Allostella humosa]|uniref:FAD-dependent oxidoreductase n=1 Tax=Stella humosa TaxID=94 RepID=UPI0014776181|nr:FAD-dependent oxidoreductase [Stella humosa]